MPSANPNLVSNNATIHEEPESSTWSDTFSVAFTSCSACLPCLRKIPSDDSLHNQNQNPTATPGNPALYANTINNVPRARPDELLGLLASSSGDTTSSLGWSDTDDDRFSLHTNPGTSRRKRKPKKKHSGKITLFGFNLFGRRNEGKVKLDEETGDAIYRDTSTSALAPAQDEGHEPYTDDPASQSKAQGKRRRFDADAAPLSCARIAELAASASASAQSSPRLSQMNPISPPDSPSSTFPIAPSRDSADEDGFTLDEAPSVRGGHNRTHSSYLFDSSPLSPTSDVSTSSKSKSKKKKSSSKTDKNAIKTQLAHIERLKAQGTLPESNGGVEFEGFQGSGSAAPHPREGIVARRGVGTRSASSSSSGGSGSTRSRSRAKTGTTGLTSPSPPPSTVVSPFSGAQTTETSVVTTPSAFEDQEAEDEEADLDGAMYSGPRRKGYVPGGGSRSSGSRSHGRSESRSQRHARSDSRSSGGQYAQYPASPTFSGGPSPLGFHLEHPEQSLENIPRKKSSSRKSKGTSSSGTRSNRSNSVVASPLSPSFPSASASGDGEMTRDTFPSPGFSFPSTGLGKSSGGFPSTGLGKGSGGFPSAGLGKASGGGLRASDMARMLRREDEFEGF